MMNWLFCPRTPGAPFMSTAVKPRLGLDRMDDTYEALTSTFRSHENAGVLPSPDSSLEKRQWSNELTFHTSSLRDCARFDSF